MRKEPLLVLSLLPQIAALSAPAQTAAAEPRDGSEKTDCVAFTKGNSHPVFSESIGIGLRVGRSTGSCRGGGRAMVPLQRIRNRLPRLSHWAAGYSDGRGPIRQGIPVSPALWQLRRTEHRALRLRGRSQRPRSTLRFSRGRPGPRAGPRPRPARRTRQPRLSPPCDGEHRFQRPGSAPDSARGVPRRR